jgi:hypothetical protein
VIIGAPAPVAPLSVPPKAKAAKIAKIVIGSKVINYLNF